MEVLQDITTESLAIGYLYRVPDTLVEYEELISAKYDFIDDNLRLLYLVLTLTYKQVQKINETTVSIQVSKMDEETQKTFKNFGGNNAINRLVKVAANYENFDTIYQQLKTWNLIRELDRRGFPVRNNLDQLKKRKTDEILKAYDLQLAKVGSYIKNLNDSVDLGKGMKEFYTNLKKKPDIGVALPFPILNTFTRGWRTRCVYGSGMGSGLGKSREVCFIAMYLAYFKNTPLAIFVNEQDEKEWKEMLLTTVTNNIIAPKTGVYVDQEKIVTGTCNEEEDEAVQMAAEFIEKNHNINFLELEDYSYDNLKINLKKVKLKGISHVFYDTYKVFRFSKSNMASWEQFVATSELFKKIVGSPKKRGLDMALWLTFQLLDEAVVNKVLDNTATASGKQMKHNLDMMKMSRILDYKDKENIGVKIQQPNNPDNGQVEILSVDKTYYMTKVEKNRGGKDKDFIIYEVDKGKIMFKELGFAYFGLKKIMGKDKKSKN
ncbi:replicative DNA helicase [Clostridium acetobutylicum]|uniref:Phage replicative DNA helicase, YorI B.subtilis homolog n=2 Tax=Clostridiaceae TaxID=31979 RepID=Q97JT1_CLOAB|nr:replicative DNA helicase [Clostridium acetobutylicum]ADZ20242.1 Phage replicative DNA helicase [Clostridium acetobutylicum EA 2018]PSM05238.1 replicative DNA helicase [Clostridium sp. NJ4]AAK79164.1 Phage replicative DNA helicase, YorI B.subtilis homolog [Clostridium acetobutylicum ATCC 824]AEI31699.1 replicative DNA helicase [Clostridium acetobutylicum DSM 1731]AWV82254.1 replicative DNA helicase [Clostridium acetobutylicum]